MNAPDSLELMAVLAIGYIADETSARVVIPAEFQHPAEKPTSTRKTLSEIVHREHYSRKRSP
ncbi:MAG: hypothetical protein QMC78_02625 [Methanocellales archaeon]|nr:hypothetical protein [Methanocellales archaeon]